MAAKRDKTEYTPKNWDIPALNPPKHEPVPVELTKGEAHAIAELVDKYLISDIRDDVDTDSIQWLRNMVHGYEKLCKISGYVGLTESEVE